MCVQHVIGRALRRKGGLCLFSFSTFSSSSSLLLAPLWSQTQLGPCLCMFEGVGAARFDVFLATLAGLHNHVGQLLHLVLPAHVVKNWQRLQSLRNTAGLGRSSRVVMLIQGQNLRVFVFSIPDVSAGPHAVVGVIACWLMYPLPAQVLPEVDVQAPYAARLCLGCAGVLCVNGASFAWSEMAARVLRNGHGQDVGWLLGYHC